MSSVLASAHLKQKEFRFNTYELKLSLLLCLTFLCSWSLTGKSTTSKIEPFEKQVRPPKCQIYLGQNPPNQGAAVFAPDFISTPDDFVGNACFAPDGKEFLFSVTNGRWDSFEIRSTRYTDGQWTMPKKIILLEGAECLEPFITPDGSRLFFNSGNALGTDIHFCSKNGAGWGEAQKLPDPVNTPAMEWFPSLSKKNTLLITRNGKIQIGHFIEGKPIDMHDIGAPINTPNLMSGDPLISPDEDFIIFMSTNRPEGKGQGDLYISFRTEEGKWTDPKNLGTGINTQAFECSPALTPDGKFLLFTRREQWYTDKPSKIYWINSGFIQAMKAEKHTQ